MSAIQVEIKFDRADKTYQAKESVTGEVTIICKTETRHEGILAALEGSVKLHLTKAGVFDSLSSDIKPLNLISGEQILANAGKLPAGTSRFPFKFNLETSKILHETYHGVHIAIQYYINVTIRRSFPSKDVDKSAEFLLQLPKTSSVAPNAVTFRITPDTVKVGKSFLRAKLPTFLISGSIDAVNCCIDDPFSGEVTIEESSQPLKSIELQLVRIECVGGEKDILATEPTEVQNIQIGDGDVCRNLAIPIHMVFPRLFTCPTLKTPNFSIEFEVNIVVIFDDPSGNLYQLAENFPIVLHR